MTDHSKPDAAAWDREFLHPMPGLKTHQSTGPCTIYITTDASCEVKEHKDEAGHLHLYITLNK